MFAQLLTNTLNVFISLILLHEIVCKIITKRNYKTTDGYFS